MGIISVRDLPFSPVPAQREAELKYSKGIFGGVKKKFAQGLLEGKVSVCEVLVTDWRISLFRSQNTYYEYPFCQVATREEGTFCKEWVYTTREAYFSGMAEWVEDDEQNEAEVNALSMKKRIGYVLKYYLGKEERYMLIDKKCYKDLNKILGDIEPAFGYSDYTACLTEYNDRK